MNEEHQFSLIVRIGSVAFFLVLTLVAFAWFSISSIGLISQFHIENQVVGFDKGSMYMLGCGVGLLLLTIGGAMQGIFGLELTPKKQSFFTRGILISLVLMVTFPQLTHYLVEKYAQKHRYSICKDVSNKWLLYSKLYYTKTKLACNDLAKEKEITKSSSGR
jgi:hypothetical protein